MSINPNLSMLMLEEISKAGWSGEWLQVWKADVGFPTLNCAAQLGSSTPPHCWIFGGWRSCAVGTWNSVTNGCWNVGCGRLGCYFFPYINKGSPPSENAAHTHLFIFFKPSVHHFLPSPFFLFNFSLLIFYNYNISGFYLSIALLKRNLLVLILENYQEGHVVFWGTCAIHCG